MQAGDLQTTTATSTAVALSPDSLTEFANVATIPDYDRSALRHGIVHIGVGGFHRAHLATYMDELASLGNTDWGIAGIGVLPGDAAMADALGPQGCLYTLVVRSADTHSLEIIGSIVEYLHVADDAQLLIGKIAAPDTQIVSMTITEGGYPVDDVTGEFVAAKSPRGSVFDLLAKGLNHRRMTGASGITVMSCDNIMTNGAVARTATLGAAHAHSSELVEWIDANVSFPNSMVDRITPVTSATDIEALAGLGIADRWPVVTEPFRQWVVEDDFAGDRLPLEDLDVIITADIEPYELTKLRLLNAGHSCLAYLASLDGHITVDTAMADSKLREFVELLLHEEAKPTLPVATGIDLDDYIESLVERFSNPSIGDQIARLCLDGTAKFPKFLIPTVRAQVELGHGAELSALALAGWCEYLNGNRDGLASDPQLDVAIEHARRSIDTPAAFLQLGAVFGTDLANATSFVEAFEHGLKLLRSGGVQSAVGAVVAATRAKHDEHSD